MAGKKQISVVSIPLLHIEKWQQDDLLKRMEIARKEYNSALSTLIKRMHVMERTRAWRNNVEALEKNYEESKKPGKEDETKEEKKERLEKIREEKNRLYEEKNGILNQYGFSQYGFQALFIGKEAKFNFSPENIPSNMAALSIANPLWDAFEDRYFPKKRTKEGDLPMPSFKNHRELMSLSTNGKSGMRLKEEDGKLWLILSNLQETKKKIVIPIEYSDLNLYEKEALSNPIKILTLQAEKVKNRYAFYLNVSYGGLPPVKISKNGEIKHVFNKKGKVGIAVWNETLCAVSDDEVYITSLECQDHFLNEEEIATINREMDKLKRLRDFQNYDEDGTIKKGLVAENGKRMRLKWHFSENYKKLAIKKREIYRKEREQKELHHWDVVNHLLSMGNQFVMADTAFSTQKPEFDEDDRLTNAEYRKKKKKRKATMASAPSDLLSKLNNRSVAIFSEEVQKIDIPKEEYWYSHEYNTSREEQLSNQYVVVEGKTLLQTAYRAFLIRGRKDGKYDVKWLQEKFPAFVEHYKTAL